MADTPFWKCPMCGDSFVVSRAAAVAWGTAQSYEIVGQFQEEHIDWHCEIFADEMELAC